MLVCVLFFFLCGFLRAGAVVASMGKRDIGVGKTYGRCGGTWNGRVRLAVALTRGYRIALLTLILRFADGCILHFLKLGRHCEPGWCVGHCLLRYVWRIPAAGAVFI